MRDQGGSTIDLGPQLSKDININKKYINKTDDISSIAKIAWIGLLKLKQMYDDDDEKDKRD